MKLSLAWCCALLAFAAGPRGLAQSYSFTTIAGLQPQPGAIDGAGSDARFSAPFSTAVDGALNVYVVDVNNNTIRKITPAGVVTTFAGKAGQKGSADGAGSDARFNIPQAIATDSAGNVYVADYGNSIVRKITPAGVVSTLAGVAGSVNSIDGTGAAARFAAPGGIAVDGDGNVFVADWLARNIRKISPAGVVSTIAGLVGTTGSADGAGTNARFANPSGIAIDATGNLYVADTTNYTIRKITPAGVVSTFAGLSGTSGITNGTGTAARFDQPLGLAIDGDGNVFVADSGNDSIRKITPAGVVTTFAGTNGIRGNLNATGSAARFFSPCGICVDRNGNFYVADALNETIRKITSAAVVSNFAGPGGSFGTADGTGSVARFNDPHALAFDNDGNIIIADTGNYTVRKSTIGGAVTTFLGVAGTLSYVNGNLNVARPGYPAGVAVDSSNNIYLADLVYDSIRKITPAGVVSTLAGNPNLTGAVDGTGTAALFNSPFGVVCDRDGNVFVADKGNHAIRKITPGGTVTTLAGALGTSGTANGTGNTARFNGPSGIAIDGAGNLFVADTSNHAIRKITPDGVVTTVAGTPGTSGSVNGNGAAARFLYPYGIAVDAAGNIFVADTDNNTIRKITSDGTVSTIAGLAGAQGSAEGSGANARFLNPLGVIVDGAGILYVVDAGNNVLMRGEVDRPPAFTIQPQASITVAPGGTVVLSATATGGGLTYQWKLNGIAVTGATSPTLTLTNVQSFVAGSYTLEVTNSVNTITSQLSKVAISNTSDFGRIINLAIRAQAGTGAQTLIVGVAVGGNGTSGTKPILIRGVGPTLSMFSVPDVLSDPTLSVYQGASIVGSNDDWKGDAEIVRVGGQVGAFAYASAGSKDAAFYNGAFAPSTYTVQIVGVNGVSGVALAEVYDATPPGSFNANTPRLTNVSARTQVGTGGNILIAGFNIGGSTAKTVLIRATGPALDLFGVLGVLADPKLDVIRADTGATVASNDNWGGSASLVSISQSVGAFALSPTSKDAALVITLPPGGYTAQVKGVGDTTGVALIEVYEVQ